MIKLTGEYHEDCNRLINRISELLWQDISSAPRNGTVIDLWHRDGFRMTDVWWDEGWTCLLDDSEFTHWQTILHPTREREVAQRNELKGTPNDERKNQH